MEFWEFYFKIMRNDEFSPFPKFNTVFVAETTCFSSSPQPLAVAVPPAIPFCYSLYLSLFSYDKCIRISHFCYIFEHTGVFTTIFPESVK